MWDGTHRISLTLALAIGLLTVPAPASPTEGGVACPFVDGKPPRYVDLFDGRPEDLAYLVPDHATKY